MTRTGTVRSFSADEGWGVIDGPDVPGGCWFHFSAVRAPGYRSLRSGQRVAFTFEPADQDGYAYRATAVGSGPDPQPSDPSPAYHSTLTISFDD